MNIPQPTSFARPTPKDPYNLRNGRNPPGTSLSRNAGQPLGPASLRVPLSSSPYAPLNYDPYQFPYTLVPLRSYGPSSSGFGERPFAPPILGFVPSSLFPVAGGRQLASHRPYVCKDETCRHSWNKDVVYNDQWRPDHLSCTITANSCTRNVAGSYTNAITDIVVRDKARIIRSSYLHENPKFVADLNKYIDKKDEDTIPDKVVDLLINFVNTDSYENSDIVDEVTLCILASSVGAKSVIDKSFERLKILKGVSDIAPHEAAQMTPMILTGGSVDKGLMGWLKKVLGNDDRLLGEEMYRTREFQKVLSDKPEIDLAVRRLLEFTEEPKDGSYRAMSEGYDGRTVNDRCAARVHIQLFCVHHRF